MEVAPQRPGEHEDRLARLDGDFIAATFRGALGPAELWFFIGWVMLRISVTRSMILATSGSFSLTRMPGAELLIGL